MNQPTRRKSSLSDANPVAPCPSRQRLDSRSRTATVLSFISTTAAISRCGSREISVTLGTLAADTDGEIRALPVSRGRGRMVQRQRLGPETGEVPVRSGLQRGRRHHPSGKT